MDPLKLDSNLGYLMSTTMFAMQNHLQSILTAKGMEIPFEQARMLAFLSKHPGINQQEIADKLNKAKPGVSRLVDQLEKKGFVRREEDPEDRRNKKIFISDEGLAVRDVFIPIAHGELRMIEKELGKSEAEQLKKTLRKLKSILLEKREQ